MKLNLLKRKILSAFCLITVLLFSLLPTTSLAAQHKGKILFVPHDDRPTSGEISAEAINMLGYEVVIAPKELLGGLSKQGNPAKLGKWAKEHAKDAIAAVISSDAMIYGGLVASRIHGFSVGELDKGIENIVALKKENPALKLYVFGSLMRTPSGPNTSGGEEPEYYKHYGREIFQRTGLIDKKSMENLSNEEEQQLIELISVIPNEVWQDWNDRRQKNLEVSKTLIDLTRSGALGYFIIGKDDNAPLSATHMEGRDLTKYSHGVLSKKFRIIVGIDEIAMLLLARAVNENEKRTPKVKVRYNSGTGGNTIPIFSDEPISNSIKAEIDVAGGKEVFGDDYADLLLFVNTNPDGHTDDGDSTAEIPVSKRKPRSSTKEFVDMIEDKVSQNYKVAVADIAFANSSDNALIEEMYKRKLLMKINAYAGWNTATNSTGFVIGQGMIATRLSQNDYTRLLMERYLDDYVYQGNIRKKVMDMLHRKYCNPSLCLNLGEYEEEVAKQTTIMMRKFATEHLPKYHGLDKLEFYFPWHRTFIGAIVLPE